MLNKAPPTVGNPMSLDAARLDLAAGLGLLCPAIAGRMMAAMEAYEAGLRHDDGTTDNLHHVTALAVSHCAMLKIDSLNWLAKRWSLHFVENDVTIPELDGMDNDDAT